MTLATVAVPTSAQAVPRVDCSARSTPPTTRPATGTRPVVFVHGWGSGGDSMRSAGGDLRRLAGNRITPYYFDYGSRSTTWVGADVIAGCLSEYLRQVAAASSDGKVLVVAHSMGGLAVLYAAADPATARALGGVVTFSAPFEGSPFGGTALGALLQGVHLLRTARPPEGADAQVCLGPRRAGGLMPAGCDFAPPPDLPASVPVTEIAGSVTIQRSLVSYRLPDLPLASDVIVPVDSAHGDIRRGTPATRGRNVETTLLTDACTVTVDDVWLAMASAGWTSEQIASLASGVAAATTGTAGSRGVAADPVALAYLLAAETTAPCSHGHIYRDPKAQRLAATALTGYLDALDAHA